MAPDYRSDRMESPEGKGRARKAWEDYVRFSNKYAGPVLKPALDPLVRPVALNMTTDLFGFWLLWQLEGGFEGLRRLGFSRSAIYRRVKRFRVMTGQHPDEFDLPGVDIDVRAYLAGDKKIEIVVPEVETTEL
jgi:hypothetical protein